MRPYPVVGKSSYLMDFDTDIIICIGNAGFQKRIQEAIADWKLVTFIHPDTVVAENVAIGTEIVVMVGVVINHGAKIGKCHILNTFLSVDHDCIVGNYVHISVGSHFCATLHAWESCMMKTLRILFTGVGRRVKLMQFFK